MWSGHRGLGTWWWLEKIPSGCHYNLPAASSRDCSKWPWFLEKGHNIKMCTSELQTDFEHRSMVKVLIAIARSLIQFSSDRPIKSDWYSFECVYIKFSFLLVIQSTSLAVSRWTYMTNLLWICQFIIGRLDSYMMAGQWPLFYTCVWHFDRLIHRVCT